MKILTSKVIILAILRPSKTHENWWKFMFSTVLSSKRSDDIILFYKQSRTVASSRTQDVRFVLFRTHQLDVLAMFLITSEQKDTLYQTNYSNFEKLKIWENSKNQASVCIYIMCLPHINDLHILLAFQNLKKRES